MNLIIALIPGLAWGLLPVITVFIGGDIKKQMLGIGFGTTLFAILLNLTNTFSYDLSTILVGLATGMAWTVGFFYQLNAIKIIGVSKTSPISNGSQLILATLFSVIFFKEWSSFYQIFLGSLAIILIAIGMKISSFNEQEKTFSYVEYKLALKYISISTLCFVTYVVGVQVFEVDKFTVILPQALGIAIVASLVFKIKNIKNHIDFHLLKCFIPGFMFFLGNICILYSYDNFGVAISFGLAQINIVVSTLSSIIILREYKTKKEFKYISIGLTTIMLGCLLLTKIK